MNPRSTPQWVVVCHLLDKVDLGLRNCWPAGCRPVFPSPEYSEALPVPADDGLGLEDEQCLFPGVEKICQNPYEESLGRSQSEFWGCACDYLELLSEKQDFEVKLCM